MNDSTALWATADPVPNARPDAIVEAMSPRKEPPPEEVVAGGGAGAAAGLR